MPERGFAAAVKRMRTAAERLVLRHRADIEALAGELVKRRTMTGDVVDHFLGIPRPRRWWWMELRNRVQAGEAAPLAG